MPDSGGHVLITGSSTGIGRACAIELERAGFSVFAGVRKEADGEAVAAAGAGGIEPVIIDVTDGRTIAAAAAQIEEATGGSLYGLVNNAGVAVPGPVEGVPLDKLREQLEINVIGQVAVTQAFLPMIRAAKGRVIFISSIGGRISVPFNSPYGASKHAIEAIGDALRQEVAQFGSRSRSSSRARWRPRSGTRARPALRRCARRWTPMSSRSTPTTSTALEAVAARSGAAGVPPERVSDAVIHALSVNKPRTRYLIGREAKVAARLRTAPSRPRLRPHHRPPVPRLSPRGRLI